MLRFGLVGCGTHARWAVLPAFTVASDEYRLTAACDLNGASLQVAQELEVAPFTSLDKMLQSHRIDAVYVCTLNDSHFEATMSSLKAGMHVLCEKPMAASVKQCLQMIETADAVDRRLGIVFQNRYYQHHRTIRDWVSAGRLGVVAAIHITDLWDGHKSFGELAARRARAIEAAGALDCGIHDLDLARYFVGGEWTEVVALGSWFSDTTLNPPHLSVTGRLCGGALVSLTSSYAYGAYIHSAVPHVRSLTVVGDAGIARYTTDSGNLGEAVLLSEGVVDTCGIASIPHSESIARLLADFSAVVNGRMAHPPELATGYDGLMAQVAMDEALRQTRARRQQGVANPRSIEHV